MPHDPTKEGKEYISAREAAKMLGITTGALKMRRYRKAEYIHHIVKENGRAYYDKEWVKTFAEMFEIPGPGRSPLTLKGMTLDKFGLRVRGHKRHCNCNKCVRLRPNNWHNSYISKVTIESDPLSPSEKQGSVTTKKLHRKHDSLLGDPSYMSRIGSYNHKRIKAKKQREEAEIQKKKFEELKARSTPRTAKEHQYIRWVHKHEMTPNWKPIHDPPPNQKKKYSYY